MVDQSAGKVACIEAVLLEINLWLLSSACLDSFSSKLQG